MSRYRRSKLRAHDNGEDRHNKGVAFLKKQTRLASEHQGAVQLAAVRRGKDGQVYVSQRRAKLQLAQALADADKQATKVKAVLAPVVWHPSALARVLRSDQRLSPPM